MLRRRFLGRFLRKTRIEEAGDGLAAFGKRAAASSPGRSDGWTASARGTEIASPAPAEGGTRPVGPPAGGRCWAPTSMQPPLRGGNGIGCDPWRQRRRTQGPSVTPAWRQPQWTDRAIALLWSMSAPLPGTCSSDGRETCPMPHRVPALAGSASLRYAFLEGRAPARPARPGPRAAPESFRNCGALFPHDYSRVA